MKVKKKSRTIVLMIGLMFLTVLVCSSYYTFFANNGKNNPFTNTVNATDSFDDDLYLHQTAAENVVFDDVTGMGYVNNELIVTATLIPIKKFRILLFSKSILNAK